MTTTLPAPADRLAEDRTIDRSLVHRWSISEVFVTDLADLGPDAYRIAAQLPTSHSYYGDGERLVDLLAVKEAVRQAATAIAHVGLGVPQSSAFLVTEWTTRILVPREVPWPSPGRLVIDVDVHDKLTRPGGVRGATFDAVVSLDGERLATSTVSARYVPRAEAETMRAYHRGSPPPWSTDLPALPDRELVDPRLVGRTRTENVVLRDAASDGATSTAVVVTDPHHRGFYDHPQDHFTGMILVEAARQLALLHFSAQASTRSVAAAEGTFSRFAELDSPVTAEATPLDGHRVSVAFRQAGTVLSTVVIDTFGSDHG